jgi:hypothetical protein
MIETLPQLTPDGTRAGRTLERCHQQLARHRRTQAPAEQRAERGQVFERALVAGLCVLDLIAVAGEILRLRGTF